MGRASRANQAQPEPKFSAVVSSDAYLPGASW
jgi:hypothetical protein